MARPARAGLLARSVRRTSLRAVVARMREAEAPALSRGEGDRLGRRSRSAGVGNHAGDEAVEPKRRGASCRFKECGVGSTRAVDQARATSAARRTTDLAWVAAEMIL